MNYYLIPLYIVFGTLPSLIWLFYYLRKDLHPEPKRMILKIFLLGCLVTIPALAIQLSLLFLLNQLENLDIAIQYPLIIEVLKWFVVIALTEEVLKYLVVKISVINTYVVDEPLDIMLYMVVAALGFTAVENLLYLLPINGMPGRTIQMTIIMTIIVSVVRFIGATFLHTLCSALLGYFLALSSLKNKKGLLLTIVGLTLAIGLHGLYDFSISTLSWPFNIIIPALVILGLTVFMIYDFNEIKKIKSICKLN